MNVMKRAWEIAKEGQEKFGGKVSEYFAESLKIAWGEKRWYEDRMNDARELLNEFRELALEAKKIDPNTQVIDVEKVLSAITLKDAHKMYLFADRKVKQARQYLKQIS